MDCLALGLTSCAAYMWYASCVYQNFDLIRSVTYGVDSSERGILTVVVRLRDTVMLLSFRYRPLWLTSITHPKHAITLRHTERNSVSNHQTHDCLLNRLFRRRSKKTSKLRVTGLCAGNSPVTGEFPAQRASNGENVSIWWRHHAISGFYHGLIISANPVVSKLRWISRHSCAYVSSVILVHFEN